MTIEELLSYHERAILGREEVFGRLVEMLTLENVEKVRAILEERPGWLSAFRPWLETVDRGIPSIAGGVVREASAAAVSAIRRWREMDQRARTRRVVPARLRPGYAHPSGSEATLVELIDRGKNRWLVEISGPADSPKESAYDYVELDISDLDLKSIVLPEADMDQAPVLEAPLPARDRQLVEKRPGRAGSKVGPREPVASSGSV